MSNDNYTGRNLYRVEVDATRVNELLKRLNDKEAKKAISSALRKSILIIRKQAQENLVSAVNDAEFSTRSFWTNKKRVTKKAAYRGIINASHFFSNAVKSKQKEAENSLEKNIIDSIMKVANKKK